MKLKARHKLIPAIAMLLVSAIAMTGASYAWFTMSRTVQVTDIELTAIAPTNLLIANAEGGNYAETTTVAENYTGSKLIPSTSFDGINFRAIDEAKSADLGSPRATSTFTDVTGKGMKVNGQADPDGYYADFKVWLKTTGEDDVDVTLSQLAAMTSITIEQYVPVAIADQDALTARGVDGLFTFVDDDGTAVVVTGADTQVTGTVTAATATYDAGSTYVVKSGIEKAVRMAILDGSDTTPAAFTGTKYIYDFDGDENKATHANATYFSNIEQLNGPIKGDEATAEMWKGTADTDMAWADESKIFTVTAGNQIPVVIRIWIEGQDTECISAYAGTTFEIVVGFSDVDYAQGKTA